MKIEYKKSFDKSFDKLNDKQKIKTLSAIEKFKINPQDKTLRLHKLKGKLKNLYSINADFDLRLILKQEGDFVIIIFIDIGTHSQLYN